MPDTPSSLLRLISTLIAQDWIDDDILTLLSDVEPRIIERLITQARLTRMESALGLVQDGGAR